MLRRSARFARPLTKSAVRLGQRRAELNRIGCEALDRTTKPPLDVHLTAVRIATFNINNVNRRLPNLLRWLADLGSRRRVSAGVEMRAGRFPRRCDPEGGVPRRLEGRAVLERRRDPRPETRAGPHPRRAAREYRRQAEQIHRSRRRGYRDRLDLPAQRQPAAGSQIQVQARLVRPP